MPVTHHRQLPRRHPGDVGGGLALADVDPAGEYRHAVPAQRITALGIRAGSRAEMVVPAQPAGGARHDRQLRRLRHPPRDRRATFAAACGVPAPRRRLRAGTPPSPITRPALAHTPRPVRRARSGARAAAAPRILRPCPAGRPRRRPLQGGSHPDRGSRLMRQSACSPASATAMSPVRSSRPGR